jgi:uncharacterized membrane protein
VALLRAFSGRLAVGAALAAVTLWLDSLLPSLPLAPASARSLLAALLAAVVTAGVFSLWMRTVALGLVSDQFSPRTLVVFLDDQFQILLAAWMSATILLQVVLLAALPDDDAAGAPAASVLVASVTTLLAFAAVLYAVTHAVRTLDLTRMVSKLADEIRRVADLQPIGTSERPPDGLDLTGTVDSPSAGWVFDLDRPAILAALPPGGRAVLAVRVGDFVARGETLAYVRESEVDADAVLDAVVIDPERRSTSDLALAVSQLVDVADHALSQPGADNATAHEALLQLSAVGCELLTRGLPPCHQHDADTDRWLVDAESWDVTDHLRAAIERLRGHAAKDPLGARHLAGVLATLRDHAQECGDHRAASALRGQLQRLQSLAEEAGMTGEDLSELQEVADRHTASSEAATGRGPER